MKKKKIYFDFHFRPLSIEVKWRFEGKKILVLKRGMPSELITEIKKHIAEFIKKQKKSI